jgi:diguanylate cyclase (GGDEF)-like protein
MALLLLDLDAFKNLNDTLGHDAGDALLVEVASRLNGARRRSDTVARLGGDEFAVILDTIRRPTDAAVIATRILEDLAWPFRFEGQEIRPRASIGITVFPDDAGSAGELLKYADIALYRAKEAGRGCWRFFDDEMRLQLEARRNRSGSCAAPSPARNWRCSTSRSSDAAAPRPFRSRRWSTGITRRAACSRRTTSCRPPRRAA